VSLTRNRYYLALIEPKQQQQSNNNNNKNEKTFYVLKRRSLSGRYEPVALYSKTNNFLGNAVFDSLDECIEYQKEFDERLMKKFLKPKKYKKDFGSRIQYVESCKTRNSGLTKIFEETKRPIL
jgi:hypothetical protein